MKRTRTDSGCTAALSRSIAVIWSRTALSCAAVVPYSTPTMWRNRNLSRLEKFSIVAFTLGRSVR